MEKEYDSMDEKKILTTHGSSDGALDLKNQVIEVVDTLSASYALDDTLTNVGDFPLPSREEVIQILSDVENVIYPGNFGETRIDRVNYKYYLGTKLNEIYEGFSAQIAKSLRHNCVGAHKICDRCMHRGREETV